ncbi:hypothetical protein NQ315_003942 [Exocentrus adspersus]|uniref:Uncharacterized protein n=1 Tax=Exocentrus adspersus TaxID=1586481 RepID=A0AAV8VZN6_9CUCU|nr:hypothetical protein NQ315_003942 [Exocentrus adspersus]
MELTGIVYCILRRKSLTFPDDVKFACRGHRPRQITTHSYMYGNIDFFLQAFYDGGVTFKAVIK